MCIIDKIIRAFIKFKKKARIAETVLQYPAQVSMQKPPYYQECTSRETRHEKSRQTFAERGKGGRLSGGAWWTLTTETYCFSDFKRRYGSLFVLPELMVNNYALFLLC